MLKNVRIPILGIVAFSGTGKTTLLLKLLPMFRDKGLRIAMVKHAHHSFEIDRKGKDSFELRTAGASRMLIASRHRWALMMETPEQHEPHLDSLLGHLPQHDLDLLLVEGFKQEIFPKIEIHRLSLGHPLLFPNDPHIIAIATDDPIHIETTLPVLDINDATQIFGYMLDWLSHQGDEPDTV
ncbi:MAG: molybdopterin-guanine dinucleotide biosynthesis protein B [Gammaproteobacteria bacterium]|nr:molybdopterin-guanine dinucleotide biosynthesis protein B [Gammaproteobacteria bacterium]